VNHADIGAETVLQVAGLSKVFPVRSGLLGRGGEVIRAVDDISLTVRKGETLGLVGESGCGKSTAGKTIMRLYEPTSGTISLKGQDITHLRGRALRAIRRELQIVFQDPFSSLNPRMTAGQIVGEPLTIHGLARGRQKADRVAELFHRVGLRPDQMRRYPHEFSGGQRQRLAIARALSVDPDLIVADESVSALDVSIQASIINLMMDIQKEHGLSFLFIAHDIAVVEHISDRIAVMYLGRIVEMGPRARIVRRPGILIPRHFCRPSRCRTLTGSRILSGSRAMCPARSTRPRAAPSTRDARWPSIAAASRRRPFAKSCRGSTAPAISTSQRTLHDHRDRGLGSGCRSCGLRSAEGGRKGGARIHRRLCRVRGDHRRRAGDPG
jgi:ABC-type oligopeptide transport system ATPase subunit